MDGTDLARVGQSPQTPRHLLMAAGENGIPLMSTVGLTSESDLKLAIWRGQLRNVTTRVRTDYHTICFSMRGAPVSRLDQRERSLVAGGFFFQPASSAGRFESDDVLEYTHLYLRVGLLNAVAEGIGAPPPGQTEIPDAFGLHDDRMAGLVRACLGTIGDGTEPSRTELDSWAQVIGAYTIRNASQRARHVLSKRSPQLSPANLSRVMDAIEAGLHDELPLATMAALTHLSPFQFLRAFKNSMGTTPHQYVLKRRVARACDLLAQSDWSLASIAHEVGFSSQSHMNRAFRRELNCTPGQYRADRLG